MAKAQKVGTDGPERPEIPDGSAPSPDKLYQLLANQRRRYAIHYLKYQDGTIQLGLLAEQVAAWEENIEPSEVAASRRKSVYTGLQQRHLPKMDETGLVSFDRSRGVIEPTDLLHEIDLYTEPDQSGEFPWCYYYLMLSTVTGAALLASWANVPLFSATTPAAWGTFGIVSLAISASIHTLTTRELERETGQRPSPADN